MKFFSIEGPVNPEKHYCLPLKTRLDEEELRLLITQDKYFVLHAPRQTGKTSTMINFARTLNEEGVYTALYVNIEGGQAARADYNYALPMIVQEIATRVTEQLPTEKAFLEIFKDLKKEAVPAGSLLTTLLSRWCAQSQKPIVLFIDEIDSLVGDTLISVLRQLRAGYDKRPKYFPQSLCLIGVRDVRDYRIWSDEKQAMVLGGSAFNIKAKSLRMADFTEPEVRALYLQHTAETGQKFTDDAIAYAFELTQGQPWLVNALAQEACFELQTDRTKPITKDIIETVKEILIKRRDTHLDVLLDRLNEPRVYAIIDAIINGQSEKRLFPNDDVLYCIDLGLIKRDKYEVANPIYQDIFPRALTQTAQNQIEVPASFYKNVDGSLNTVALLESFQQFYRENSASLLTDFNYRESGPHLLLMAYLQRVINGGGSIHREYALGRKRVDLLVRYRDQRIVIEMKVWHGPKALEKGLEQTAEYMDISRATEGHLVIFDRRLDKSWDERIYHRQEMVGDKTIDVWGA